MKIIAKLKSRLKRRLKKVNILVKFKKLTKEEKEMLLDPSLWVILGTNIFTMVVAWRLDWSVGELMWVFWSQSVIIGIMAVIRMLTLKEFTAKGIKLKKGQAEQSMRTKATVAGQFILHYGFFHACYAGYLWKMEPLNKLDPQTMHYFILCVSAFFITHAYSLKHNALKDFKNKKPEITTLFAYPYVRVFPMHIMILVIWPLPNKIGLVIFMILKTLADAGMHMVEHSLFRQKDKKPKVKN